MRMTTRMLNTSARRAGVPAGGTSLLNYVQNGAKGSRLSAMQKSGRANVLQNTGRSRSVDRTKYDKLEKAADGLGRQADKFTAAGEKSLFGKAKESGDYTAVYRELEDLVDRYNSTVSALESVPGTMNNFYRTSMQELISDNREALSGMGISVGRQGRLQVDQEKLRAAEPEEIEKFFGKEGKFTARLSYLAGRVEDNAGSNLASAYGGYSAKGDITGAYRNRYDYRG